MKPEVFFFKDDGMFPNSPLPVLLYRKAISVPRFLPYRSVRKIFRSNGWKNNWKDGIINEDHYHSTSHEALACIKGKSQLKLGGTNGLIVWFEKGDVLIIPAGVAHANLHFETSVVCVGGYPDGRLYDMNFGKAGERPGTDRAIAALPIPSSDPVYGKNGPLTSLWK